ncbi:hypothetical protein LIER_13341 [Lithospermum erythrorhizon]|uniref:GTP-binding protein OBGC, chloroplastic n=1 Tax=Lithospermum erythrorhizon TaxID=34254 RepID=A0AAV3PXK8_LITER
MYCSIPMITSSSSTLHSFTSSPIIQARIHPNPNKTGPNKPRKPGPNKHLRKPTKLKSKNIVVPGGEATTYTRLPPKEDIFLGHYDEDGIVGLEISSLKESKYAKELSLNEELKKDDIFLGNYDEDSVVGANGSEIISFSESMDAKELNLNEEFKKRLEFEGGDEEVVGRGKGKGRKLGVGENGRKVEVGEGLGFDYGKFELYELDGSDYESDNDDDFDENLHVMGFEGEGSEGIKEKGVPAVMRCFDRAKIFVRAGDGGNGVVAMRREKFVPLGGPSGGDGGRGGNVYVEVEGSMNSLLPFRQRVHFRAGRGSHGQGSKQNGAKGEDVVVKVPPGTVIREATVDEFGGQGDVLLELLHPGQRALLLPGGKGGRGNASFKSGMNKVPKIAENGEEGLEMWLELELKLVADVGIVGAPNAGKSTFLSVVSAAQPAIANYPFTTLLPNLGVVSFDYDATMVVADLPGLLEGAHRGFGLGHEFLRHTERCSVLVHIIDGSSQQPEYEFDAVRLELEMFNPEVTEKPFLVVYNKMDLPEASENWISFRESLCARGIEPFCMSAVMADGTHEVICAAYELVQKRREAYKDEAPGSQVNLNHVADMMQKQRTAPINEFEISHDSDSGVWHVDGAGLLRFVQMTNWRYIDSERRFQHVLDACGVFKSLVKLGVKEGDTVFIGEMEMVWHDSSDNSGPARLKKWAEKSIK